MITLSEAPSGPEDHRAEAGVRFVSLNVSRRPVAGESRDFQFLGWSGPVLDGSAGLPRASLVTRSVAPVRCAP